MHLADFVRVGVYHVQLIDDATREVECTRSAKVDRRGSPDLFLDALCARRYDHVVEPDLASAGKFHGSWQLT